jgi:hypothetical protein
VAEGAAAGSGAVETAAVVVAAGWAMAVAETEVGWGTAAVASTCRPARTETAAAAAVRAETAGVGEVAAGAEEVAAAATVAQVGCKLAPLD